MAVTSLPTTLTDLTTSPPLLALSAVILALALLGLYVGYARLLDVGSMLALHEAKYFLFKTLRRKLHISNKPRVLNETEALPGAEASTDAARLNLRRTRKALSSDGGGDDTPSAIAHDLHSILEELKSQNFIDEEQGSVDYERLAGSLLWQYYLEQVHRLHKCESLTFADLQEAKSFWINIYNSLTIHGLIDASRKKTSEADRKASPDASGVELPATVLALTAFWEEVAYRIGTEVFTLDDIEHGILRCNRPHPSNAAKQTTYFAPGDARYATSSPSSSSWPLIYFFLHTEHATAWRDSTLACTLRSCAAASAAPRSACTRQTTWSVH